MSSAHCGNVDTELTVMTFLYSSTRFRMLADHFQTMYHNLNIDVDGELQQLKVTTGHNAEAAAVQRLSSFSCSSVTVTLITRSLLLLPLTHLTFSELHRKMCAQELHRCF